MKSVPLDLALFSATAAAFVGHLYLQRMPCRRARTQKQVSFRLDPPLEVKAQVLLHPSIAAAMPSLFELGGKQQQPCPPIIGLLFAAGWCPDCTDVVPAVGKVLLESSAQRLVEIIYVGSDNNEEALLKFKPAVMKHIPIAAVQERSDLKRKFRTCAAKEMSNLGITDRKNGIPTLILLEAATGRTLSEAGIDDVTKGGSPARVLDGWRDLLSSSKSP